MDADQLRIEQAADDVDEINHVIIGTAKRLSDSDSPYSDTHTAPTDSDRRWVIQQIVELRKRRDELEDRLVRSIEDGIGRERNVANPLGNFADFLIDKAGDKPNE